MKVGLKPCARFLKLTGEDCRINRLPIGRHGINLHRFAIGIDRRAIDGLSGQTAFQPQEALRNDAEQDEERPKAANSTAEHERQADEFVAHIWAEHDQEQPESYCRVSSDRNRMRKHSIPQKTIMKRISRSFSIHESSDGRKQAA